MRLQRTYLVTGRITLTCKTIIMLCLCCQTLVLARFVLCRAAGWCARTHKKTRGWDCGGRVVWRLGGVLLDGTIINDWFKKKANQKLWLFLSLLRIFFAGKNKMAGNSPAGPPNWPGKAETCGFYCSFGTSSTRILNFGREKKYWSFVSDGLTHVETEWPTKSQVTKWIQVASTVNEYCTHII